MMNKVKVLLVTTDLEVSIKEVDLNGMNELLSGYIERVKPDTPWSRGMMGNDMVMLVNEDGHSLDLSFNPVGTVLYGFNPILGNIIIVKEGRSNDGEIDFISLTDEDIGKFKEKLINLSYALKERIIVEE